MYIILIHVDIDIDHAYVNIYIINMANSCIYIISKAYIFMSIELSPCVHVDETQEEQIFK